MSGIHIGGDAFVRDIWFVAWPGGDWAGVLWKEQPKAAWRFDCRYRYEGRKEASWIHFRAAGSSQPFDLSSQCSATARVIAESKRRQHDGVAQIEPVHQRINGGGKQLMVFLAEQKWSVRL